MRNHWSRRRRSSLGDGEKQNSHGAIIGGVVGFGVGYVLSKMTLSTFQTWMSSHNLLPAGVALSYQFPGQTLTPTMIGMNWGTLVLGGLGAAVGAYTGKLHDKCG